MNGFTNESGVIGAILIDEGALNVAREIVGADDFRLDANRKIYTAALALAEEDKPVDPMTILGIIGDSYSKYMMELMEITPTSANVEHYAKQTRKDSMWRSLQELGSILINADTNANDPRDAVGEVRKELQRIENMETAKELTNSSEALQALYDHRAAVDTGKGGCVRTGFRHLDALLGGGLLDSGLYILAARPGMGKTTFALTIADKVAGNGHDVLFVSLEMDNEQLMAKRVARETGISESELLMSQLTREQYGKLAEAAAKLAELPLYMNKKTWVTIEDIRNMARGVKNLRLLVVDYFGLIKATGKFNGRYEAMTEVSRQLKELARNLNIPILCLAQLNRENANRKGNRPQLSDLRDTGALEQDADGVMFLHRLDYYSNEGAPAEGPIDLEVILAKNRHGATGKRNMDFYLRTGRIVPQRY